jgi:uncharacterized protein (TIGR00725 family)
MRPIIAVIGDTHLERKQDKWNLAVEIGERLVDEGFRIVTGGLGDLPQAVAEGARSSKKYEDGALIALLPSYDPSDADKSADIVIATGLDHARNMIVANSDGIIAIGGGAGTLSEIALAWALKRPIVALKVSGWSGKLAGTRIDERIRYADIKDDKLYEANTAADAVRIIKELITSYKKRHSRIAVRT